ncbi:MAG: ABC transporter ATP-binding protein, partial [Planctomycetaceae bacterium]|nr:ABC transporter ATP-binding protein [Planctomycetaceae bacterium]
MRADVYRRARTLLASHHDLVMARLLGALQAFLLLGLVAVLCLFLALLAARGYARFPRASAERLPKWAYSYAEADGEYFRFRNMGLFPLVANNLLSNNPIHRAGAWILDRVSAVLMPLRNNSGAHTTLLAMGLLFLVALSLLSQWRRFAMAKAATDLATTLRHQIHRQVYRLGQPSLPTEGVGPIVHIWTREVNDIRDGLIADVEFNPRMWIFGAGLVLIALLVSPILTLFLISLGLLVAWTSRFLERDAREVQDAALRDVSVNLCLLHEDLGLLRTVRVHGIEAYDRKRFDDHLDRFREADLQRIMTEPRVNPTAVLFYGAATTLALGLLGLNVLIRERISLAAMLVLLAALAGLAYPIGRGLQLRRAIHQADRSAASVFEFLERSPELHQTVGAHFLGAVKDQITLENVTLKSRSGRTLLEQVSLEIPAGSRTVIMGLDEDSKHAFACLIPRLIDPQSGRVMLDGHDLREVTLESNRAQVSMVLQADLVFTDSVLVNIGMGDPLNGLPRVIEAAKLAHAHQFIKDLLHGYETIIGPLGHCLKPDEQFRIALARAYLHDPSIIILEEPSGAIDEDT